MNNCKNKDKFYNLDKKKCLDSLNYNYIKDEIVLFKTAKYFNKNIKDIKIILSDIDDIDFNNIYIRYMYYLDNINIVDIKKI